MQSEALVGAVVQGMEEIEHQLLAVSGSFRASEEVSAVEYRQFIAGELSNKIFEPYFFVRTAARKPGSIGLGLSVSRSLAGRLGGNLTYRRVDGETVFRLTLPAALSTSDYHERLVST